MVDGAKVGLDLVIGFAASLLLASGLFIMKGRASALPLSRSAGIARAVISWVRDPIWLGGLAVQTLGYALYVAALTGAPVSMLSVVMQGGIAIFVLLAVIFLGERASLWEWAGITSFMIAALMLSVSLDSGAAPGPVDPTALAVLSAVTIAAAAILGAAPAMRQSGVAVAIISGVAFGLASLYTKGMAMTLPAASGLRFVVGVALNPLAWLVVISNITGLVLLQDSFRMARGIVTMPLSSAISNLVPIAGGMIAFGERLPSDPAGAAMRLGAFALTIAASGALAVGDLTGPSS